MTPWPWPQVNTKNERNHNTFNINQRQPQYHLPKNPTPLWAAFQHIIIPLQPASHSALPDEILTPKSFPVLNGKLSTGHIHIWSKHTLGPDFKGLAQLFTLAAKSNRVRCQCSADDKESTNRAAAPTPSPARLRQLGLLPLSKSS